MFLNDLSIYPPPPPHHHHLMPLAYKHMSSSLLLQPCPVYLVRLIWMVLEMGSRRPYSSCFVGCYFLDLFNIARSILVQFPSSFFSIRLVNVHVVLAYSSMDTTAAWKNGVLFYQKSLTSL